MVLDEVADFRAGDLQERQRALHVNLLAQALHAEREVERERAAHLDDDRAPLRGQASQTRFDGPRPNTKRGKKEAAFSIGHPLHDRPGRGVGRDDGRPRQHTTDAVADDAADFSGVDLRGGHACPEREQQRKDTLH